MSRTTALDTTPLLRHPPGPTLFEIFKGYLRGDHRNMLGLLERDIRRFGDVVQYRKGRERIFFSRHPDHVRHILETGHLNFRRSHYYDMMKVLLGEGLVTSDGALWKRQRRLIQPFFNRQRVLGIADTVTQAAEELAGRWLTSESPRRMEINAQMIDVTLVIAGLTMFTTDVGDLVKVVKWALPEALVEIDRRVNELFVTPAWIPTARNRRLRRAIEALDQAVHGLIAKRKAEGGGESDIFSALMNARDPDTGEGMSDKQIRDEVLTLLMAGHETTATWLSWTLHLLASEPEAERRLQEELDTVLGGRTPTVHDLPQLPYMARVMQESLRLRPPAWALDRVSVDDDVIGGYHVPGGSIVFLSPYMTHRHPEFWDEPEKFDPDRFLPERSEGRPKYAYFPFGGGPRQCVGRDFAQLEAQLIFATLYQRFTFHAVPGRQPTIWPAITLRPVGGIWMDVAPR